jgi:hypothetical protein
MSLLAQNSTPAEILRGISFSEGFRNRLNVARNNGLITGNPVVCDGAMLDGTNDYITYGLNGSEFDSDEISIVIEFWPDFDWDADKRIVLLDTNSNDYRLQKLQNSGANALSLFMGGSYIADIASSAYSPYWKQGEKNTIVISGKSGDTSVWLNGIAILLNDTSVWAGSVTTVDLFIGVASTAINLFDGTIKQVKVFKSLLTEQEAKDFYHDTTYSYMDKAILNLPMRACQHQPSNSRTLDVSGSANHAVFGAGSAEPTKLQRRGYSLDGVNDNFSGLVSPTGSYTFSYLKKVDGIYTVVHENNLTTFTQLTTSGGYTGEILEWKLYPLLLTQLQKYDDHVKMMREINNV